MLNQRLCSEVIFSAIDFESAGAEPGDTDVPVQIGIAQATGTAKTYNLWVSYIHTDKPIQWSASKVHGITKETLKGSPNYTALWPNIKGLLQNNIIVGHNLSTEKRFLRQFPGHNFGPWLDTLTLARECLPGLGNYSLESVSEALGVTKTIQKLVKKKTWHDALFDATASLIILQKVISALHLENAPLYSLGQCLKEK